MISSPEGNKMPISKSLAVDIVKMVATRYRVSYLMLLSATKVEPFISCRAEAMYVLREFKFSFPEIGLLFNRNHTTVMAACKKVEERLSTHTGYKEEVATVAAEARKLVQDSRQVVVTSGFAEVSPPIDTSGDVLLPVREPPLLTLLKTGRDELMRSAQAMHRLSMLFTSAITRLECAEEQPITINTDRADEEVPS